MKNNLFVAITFIWTLTGNAHALNETAQIEQMAETLQKQGLTGFIETVRANQWDAPRIPSKWFVDSRITGGEEKRRAAVARDFGYQLAIQLDKFAQEQQTLPPANVLFQRSILLCDAGDWCTKTVGYGNIFLAQRCIDLAAVGLARLTASLEFPLTDCEKLAAKMRPEWQGMAYRLRVLNGEAEANLFINANVTDEQLDWQWAIGWTLRVEKEKKKTLVGFIKQPDPGIVNVHVVTNNLDFFVENESPLLPFTLLRSWDCRRHRIIAMGLGLQTVDKALGLLDFRKVIGFFPKEFVRSEEEWRKLREEIKEAAKWGARITPEEESSSYDPLNEAFRRAWLNRPNRKIGDQDHYGTAFHAYKDVISGRFFDRDTAQIDSIWQQKRMKESFKAK